MAYDKNYYLAKKAKLHQRYQKKTEAALRSITQELNAYWEDKNDLDTSLNEINALMAEVEKQEQGKMKYDKNDKKVEKIEQKPIAKQ